MDDEDHGRLSPDVMWPYMEGRVVSKQAVEPTMKVCEVVVGFGCTWGTSIIDR